MNYFQRNRTQPITESIMIDYAGWRPIHLQRHLINMCINSDNNASILCKNCEIRFMTLEFEMYKKLTVWPVSIILPCLVQVRSLGVGTVWHNEFNRGRSRTSRDTECGRVRAA